eukprot:13102065-Alexandrium_andersonii.AAC.1
MVIRTAWGQGRCFRHLGQSLSEGAIGGGGEEKPRSHRPMAGDLRGARHRGHALRAQGRGRRGGGREVPGGAPR